MRRLPNPFILLLLLLGPVGCAFSPGEPPPPTGAAGSGDSSGGAGTGGVTGISGGAGQGLTGGDVGLSGSAGTMSCASGAVPIMPLPPDILLVEDRSGSMDDDKNDATCNGGCGANSKWALITAAINTAVSMTDMTVNWGLKFFADADAQCGVNAGVAVPVAAGSGPAVAAAIAASTKGNGGVNNGSYTPTRAAVTAATAYLKGLTDPNQKYIVLATDGLPNCPNGCGNGGMSCTTTPNAAETTQVENAITAAATAGFPTFVVGIATVFDPDANTALNGFATAGGVPQAGAATGYYSVDDTASLVTALNSIVGKITSCTISLAPVPAADANTGNFVISVTDATTGKPTEITKDATNGWSYTDANMTSIVLNGTSCANLQNGTYSSFAFNYACAGAVICIDPNDPRCANQ